MLVKWAPYKITTSWSGETMCNSVIAEYEYVARLDEELAAILLAYIRHKAMFTDVYHSFSVLINVFVYFHLALSNPFQPIPLSINKNKIKTKKQKHKSYLLSDFDLVLVAFTV